MIKGHGIDIESIAAIEKAYQKNTRFAEKVLTEAERERFEELSGKRENGIFNGPMVRQRSLFEGNGNRDWTGWFSRFRNFK